MSQKTTCIKSFRERLLSLIRADQGSRSTHLTKSYRTRLQVEILEERAVPTVYNFSPITDMTQLAANFGRHSGPTILYLNFDGNSTQGVSSFQSVSGDRTKDIHDVIFKTAQIFAPFDVQVQRIYGDGMYSSSGGNTTIFIGDNTTYGTGAGSGIIPGAANHPQGAANGSGAFTPWAYSDFPGANKGLFHTPNSDTFDLAYVDPLYYSSGTNVSRSTSWIARAIAHEAGHTFGLVHVLSSPDQEIMSYNASNVRFVNKTFAITNLNYNPSTGSNYNEPMLQPQYFHYMWMGWGWMPYVSTIVTQNSYTYLQTALGSRSTSGDWANVADTSAVDSTYINGFMPSLSVGSSTTGSVNRAGDFDTLQFSTLTSQWVTIDVKRFNGSTVDPVLMVYNSTGSTLLYFDDDSGSGVESKLSFYASAGETYKIVVGSYGGNSTGSYQISISPYSWRLASFSPTIYEASLTTISFSGFSGSGAGASASIPTDDDVVHQVFAQMGSSFVSRLNGLGSAAAIPVDQVAPAASSTMAATNVRTIPVEQVSPWQRIFGGEGFEWM